jgi:hypothetical protein
MASKKKRHFFQASFCDMSLDWDGSIRTRFYGNDSNEEIFIEIPINTLYGMITHAKKAIKEARTHLDNIEQNMKS